MRRRPSYSRTIIVIAPCPALASSFLGSLPQSFFTRCFLSLDLGSFPPAATWFSLERLEDRKEGRQAGRQAVSA